MFHSTLTLVHISGAVIGLLSGFLSMLFRKGSGLHRVAGNFFFVSMLTMSSAGAYIAAFLKPNIGNVMGGLLTFYLVATAWVAARRRERKVGLFDFCALILVSAVGIAQMTFGIQAANSPTGLKAGYPPALYFVFGSIALMFAASDGRMIVRGGFQGAKRIARHLFRMCLALLFATASFYPARAGLFSKAINQSNVLYLPHILIIGAMIFWMVRVLGRKRVPTARVIVDQIEPARRAA